MSVEKIQFKDFLKVVLMRKDFSRWIENKDFRMGLKGCFVKVTYHNGYVLA